jgi:hypothetical protein
MLETTCIVHRQQPTDKVASIRLLLTPDAVGCDFVNGLITPPPPAPETLPPVAPCRDALSSLRTDRAIRKGFIITRSFAWNSDEAY